MNTQTAKPNDASPAAPKEIVIPESYSFSKDGFPLIKKATMTFAACFVLSATAIAGSTLLNKHSEEKRVQAQAQYRNVRDMNNQAENERLELRDFRPKFELLKARGFYGEEQRLLAIETLRRIQEERHLPGLEYSFLPQQAFQLDPTLLPDTLQLRASRLHLQLELLHELDFFRFMEDLKTSAFAVPTDCTFERLAYTLSDVQTTRVTARLAADCNLYWLTVAPPAATGEPAQ